MALDKGHIDCAAFIAHPRQHLQNWIQQKRQLQGAWQLPSETGGTKYKELDGRKKSIKKRLSFSFFSKMKVYKRVMNTDGHTLGNVLVEIYVTYTRL